MSTIKAPFNFVPLNEKVYFPEWANQISQDIPFEDGVSGSIELKLTALTPIFVRNGHSQSDGENKTDRYKSFSKSPDGRYFIPSTSIKGAVRSVLEIMSFGKMNLVQNDRFYVRDFRNKDYTNRIKSVHCGWMTLSGDTYTIDDHGEPSKVMIDMIDSDLGGHYLSDFISKTDFTNDANKLAKRKYEIIYNVIQGRNAHAPIDDEEFLNTVDDSLFIGNDRGTYVLTGQSSKSTYDQTKKKPKPSKTGETHGCWTGKVHEYVFPDTIERSFHYDDDEDVIQSFLQTHRNSKDFDGFWKQRLSLGYRVPVFFSLAEDGSIHSIGLTAAYKYPTIHDIYDGLTADHMSDDYDLAECIFGSLSGDSLRGRVMIGHAFADPGTVKELNKEKISLSSPHASYYPLYLGNGKTWDSDEIKLAGRKKYIMRQTLLTNRATENMESTISPIDKGVSFRCVVRYHNLRRVELGALLSALTFHSNEHCCHSLGSAKPLGYGRLQVEIQGMTPEMSDSLTEYETLMDGFSQRVYGKVWTETDQLVELFALSSPVPKESEDKFRYMQMTTTDRGGNEFVEGKKLYEKGTQLGTLTQILNNTVPECTFEGIISESRRKEIESERKQKQEDKEKIKKAKEQIYIAERLLLENGLNCVDQTLSEIVRSYGHLPDCKSDIDKLKDLIQEREAQERARLHDLINGLLSEAVSLMEQNDYVNAKQKLDEANDRCGTSFPDLSSDIAFKTQRCLEGLFRIQLREQAQERVSSGFALLEERYEDGRFKVNAFKIMESKVKTLFRDMGITSIPAGQQHYAFNTLQRIFSSLKERDKKDWMSLNGKLWITVAKWTDEETAKSWYEQIMNN